MEVSNSHANKRTLENQHGRKRVTLPFETNRWTWGGFLHTVRGRCIKLFRVLFFGTVTWPTLLYCKILLSETCGVHWSSYGKLGCDAYNYLLRLLTSLISVFRHTAFPVWKPSGQSLCNETISASCKNYSKLSHAIYRTIVKLYKFQVQVVYIVTTTL